MRKLTVCALGLAVGLVIVSGGVRVVDARAADAPVAQASATCSDYSNQAEAQRAKDTRDADGDGLYCETLPCPCAKGGSPAPGGRDSSNARERAEARAKARARARAKARRMAAARERRRRARYRNVTRSVWEVTDVIDGGRFRVTKTSGPADRDEETVRLLGIDAPTVGDAGPECGSREAKSALLAALFTASEDRNADGLLDTSAAPSVWSPIPPRPCEIPRGGCWPTRRSPVSTSDSGCWPPASSGSAVNSDCKVASSVTPQPRMPPVPPGSASTGDVPATCMCPRMRSPISSRSMGHAGRPPGRRCSPSRRWVS